mgnify:FL=1
MVVKTVQREREEKLARTLKDLLYQYVRGDKEGFLRHAESEADRLSRAGKAESKKIPVIPCFLTYKFSVKV